MEQQTISIAKAGITSILNSRAAVLAAANPVFGCVACVRLLGTVRTSRTAVVPLTTAATLLVFCSRYDDSKSAADNIDLLPTILSRFDLIFIVRDTRNERRDMEIARHVMRVHINAGEASAATRIIISSVTSWDGASSPHDCCRLAGMPCPCRLQTEPSTTPLARLTCPP